MSWSSGKDSTFALAAARCDPEVEVVGLMVTMNAAADRVAMHAVRRELLVAQADRLGLPLHIVELPWPCSNEQYEELMLSAVDHARDDGVEQFVFGDLFLEDIRSYRELLAELPDGVDPCGENGEFHTFVWDGPGFREPIAIETGPVVERDGFVFCDVRPAGSP
jgi:diphthamide synthase (EF-2-diphthine--ammonia ligase)